MKDSHPASGPLGWLWSVRPARWVPEYRSAWLPNDAIAGVTLAAYAIPVSLAYAGRAAAVTSDVMLAQMAARELFEPDTLKLPIISLSIMTSPDALVELLGVGLIDFSLQAVDVRRTMARNSQQSLS